MTAPALPSLRTLAVLALAGGLLAALSACQPNVGTAAYVGNERITNSQVDSLAQDARDQVTSTPSTSDLTQVRRQVVETLIERAAADKVTEEVGASRPTDSQVRETIEQAAQQTGQKLDADSAFIQLLVRTQLQEELIGAKVGGSQVSDQQTALQLGQTQTIKKLISLGVKLNPLYGKFDTKNGFTDPTESYIKIPGGSSSSQPQVSGQTQTG